MKKVGYDQVRISGDEKNGYKISFLPSNPQARTAIKNENIPSVEIMPSGNMGVTITNNLPAIDALHFVQNRGGEIGLARSVALGISTAARELEDRVAWLEKQNLDYDKKAKLIARTIKQAVRSVSHENPAATTKNQKEDYSKSVSLKNVGQLRREGVGAMSMQAHTSFVYKTMLNKLSGMLGKNGAPRDELAAFREFDDIAQASGGFSNIKDLENYVKKVHPWFYKNVWAGNLKNLYTTVYGIGSSQGIKKEGVSGLISLSQPILPGTQLAGISDRKMGQNLRAYSKKISNEAVQALRNFEKGGALDKNAAGKYFRFTTKQQRALYSKSELENAAHTHRAYLSADISSEHITRAAESLIKEQIKTKLGRDIAGSVSRKDIKDLEGVLDSKEQQELHHIMHDALKGVDADASVYAQQYLDDFRFAVVERKRVSREVIEDLVNEMAERAVSKTDQYKSADEAGRKNLIQLKKSLLGPQFQRQAIKKALGLNRTDKIVGVEDDQEFLGDLAVTVKQKLDNGSFTTRGLTMTDFRSATSNMNNKLFGRALELAGYRKQDIYTNGKDASGGLNIAFARGEHKMKPRDTVNGLLQLIAGNLEKQGKSKNDVIAAFGGLGGLIGNAGAAGYDFDNIALEQILASGGATGLILQLGELAVASGAVGGPGIKDNLFELSPDGSEIRWKGRKVPLPIAAGRFSGDIYQRTGQGASKMRYTEGALRSLDSTLELIRKDNPSANLSALENKRNQIAGKLAELEDTWKKRYGTSAEHIGASFQGNAAKSEAALKRAGGIAIDIAELAPMGIAEDIQYDTESGRGGILINGDDGIAILEKIKDRQKEQAKALGMDEKLAGDIPVAIYAKDANGDLIPFFTSDKKGNVHVGYHARLGSADIGERYKIGDSFYIPLDTIGKSNFDIIRTMFELSTAGTDQATMRDAQRKAGGKIASISKEMLEQMGSGSVYEKYHSFYEESGGYLLAQAMNPETRKSLYSMYGWDEGNAPSVVVGRKAMKDILSGASEDILKQQYKEFFGADPDKALDKTKLINTLVNALNIDSKNYKGKINRSSALFRFPLLKMYDDFISGGLVVSDAIAEGNMLVDPDFARTIHADFDGDRYPIFNLLLQGDYAGAEKALRQYYADKEQAQVQARIKDAKSKKKSSKHFAGIKDMEAPLDTAAEKMKMQAQNVGGKWAGISGDLLLRGVDKLAKSTNLEAEERQLIALLGQMYQVGINIKNLKPEQLKGTNAAELQNRLYGLVRKSGTWDSKEGLTNIFTIMGQLGIFGDAMNPEGQLDFTKGIFNNEVLANMGIDDPKSLGVFGMKYPNVKNLIGALMSLKGKLLSSGQQTVGQMMDNLYSGGFINTYESGVLNAANQKDLDEAAAKLVGIVGPGTEADSIFVSASQAVAKVLGKKNAGHITATSVKKMPFAGVEEVGPGARFKGLEKLVKNLDVSNPKKVGDFLAKYGDHMPLLLSTLSGNVSHDFAEGYLTGNRQGLSKKSDKYKEYVDTYAKLYAIGAISLNPAVAAANGLQQLEDGTYDPQKVAEYMVGAKGKRGTALAKLIKGQGGTTLPEIPIFGAAYGKIFQGRSDVLSIDQGKDGTTFTFSDYKYRQGKGNFEPEYGAQLLSYIYNLKAYSEAIQAFKNEGIQNAGDLFSSIATETLDPKDKSNRAGLVRLVQKWFGEYNSSGNLDQLKTVTDAIFNSNGKLSFKGQATVLGSDGAAHFYELDTYNEVVQKILDSFKNDTPLQLSEQERNIFVNQGIRENLEKGGSLTTEDELKQAQVGSYIKARLELLQTEQKYINTLAELEAEMNRKYGDSEEIKKLEERRNQLEQELKGETRWTVDKNGKPVSYHVAGKREHTAELGKGLEDIDFSFLPGTTTPDTEYYARAAALKDFKAQKSAQQQAFSTYKSVYEYDSRIEKANRSLERENNEDKREILRQEIEDLKDLRAIAQETLELLEEAHKGDPKWTDEKTGFLALAKKRAQLTHRQEQSMQSGTADGGLLGDISGQFSSYFSRFVIGRGAMTVMAKLRQGIKLLAQNAKALDGTLTNLRIVTNGTKEDTRRLMTEYSNLGQKIGATTQEVSASALEWQRQGYQTAQIQDLVTSSLYLSKLGMIDATAATKDLTNYVTNLQVC